MSGGRSTEKQFGQLALSISQRLPLQVCRSAAGYYIGTLDADGLPVSRESREYWPRRGPAEQALTQRKFTQRQEP